MHISWVTDNDSIVANNERLDDTHHFAARLSGLYVSHRLGEFMMNTVSIDTEDRGFEDFVAIPDLAAGMLAEVVSGMSTNDVARKIKIFEAQKLSLRSIWMRCCQ
jgi:hypothetical protein